VTDLVGHGATEHGQTLLAQDADSQRGANGGRGDPELSGKAHRDQREDHEEAN
jgi:hypothetical protein